MSSRRVFWALVRVGIVIALTLVVTASQFCAPSTQLPPARDIPPHERLWLVEIAPGSTDASLKPARYRIAQLHAAPDERSGVIASLFEERKLASENRLEYVWTLELASRPGQPLPWPGSDAAFDYGIHLAGAHRRGDWVRLLSSIPVDGWLRIARGEQQASVYIRASPLQGQIVHLFPLFATSPDGRTRQLDGGDYLVKSVNQKGEIEFRAEIPSDFACGELVTDPVPLPPLLRTGAAEFFNMDGSARFSMKYTKGC